MILIITNATIINTTLPKNMVRKYHYWNMIGSNLLALQIFYKQHLILNLFLKINLRSICLDILQMQVSKYKSKHNISSEENFASFVFLRTLLSLDSHEAFPLEESLG